jgi:uncharacterized protein YcbK (DUF882 family)
MYPKNFNQKEFACKGKACCKNSAPMDGAFLKKLQQLRDALERPITITSGFRCNHHNLHVGGAKSSYHTLGRACDIKVSGVDVEALAELAKEVFSGVIVYKSWVHVDIREGEYYEDKR